jgi:Xaa-Pro aminopeptidase
MALAKSEVLADRHGRLRKTIADRQLDGLVVTHLPNLFYLANFTGSSAIAVLTADRLHFITDFRYVTAVEEAWASPSGCPGASLVRVERTYDETLAELLRSLGLRRVGFEAAHVPFAQHGRWAALEGAGVEGGPQIGQMTQAAPPPAGGRSGPAPQKPGEGGIELVPTERVIEAERVRKDPHEIATLREAAAMLSHGFEPVVSEVRQGRTERQVAAGIEWVMKEIGFERAAFDTIVASGPNAALPHARPGSRLLSAGDLVVLDFGGVHDGYCVDLTRTVSIGEPDAQAHRIYAAVAEAHAAGVAASRPGATAREVDRAARGTLERLGLGDAFGHSTGHGLGIEVHEEPWLLRTPPPPARGGGEQAAEADGPARQAPPADVVIETGMVFTIEPGAYLPGWGGVRLEDDVLVTPGGAEFLTCVPRELRIL